MPEAVDPIWLVWGGLVAAVAQLLLTSRIDTAAFTLALLGAAWLSAEAQVSGLPPEPTMAAISVFALGRWRAASRGVGRPELAGLVLAVVALLAFLPVWLPWWQTASGAGPVVLVGIAALVLAAERRGLKGQRTYLHREVPVRGPQRAGRGGGSDGSRAGGA